MALVKSRISQKSSFEMNQGTTIKFEIKDKAAYEVDVKMNKIWNLNTEKTQL